MAGGEVSGFIDKQRGAGSVGVLLGQFLIPVTQDTIRDRNGRRFPGFRGEPKKELKTQQESKSGEELTVKRSVQGLGT